MEKFPNDVRILFKHNALPFHNRALPASLASLCANEQGKFWEYHDKLFANQRALEDADLEKYATELALDMGKFKECVTSKRHQKTIDRDMALAQKLNAQGTPQFFVNGRNLRGAQPYESFEALVEEELAKAKKLVASGTPVADVYKKSIEKGKTFEPLDETAHPLTAEGRPYLGNATAQVVIYEFSDFQ